MTSTKYALRDTQCHLLMTRRQFFGRTAAGIGTMALASLLAEEAGAAGQGSGFGPGALRAAGSGQPYLNPEGALFAPKAKRVIYLFQSGGPSHLDLFDYKPGLQAQFGIDLPPSVRMGQRITGMTSGQKTL